MKDKYEKRLPWIIIGILLIVIVYLLLKHNPETLSIASGSSNTCNTNNGGNGYYDGSCNDGGKYHCSITCTNTPPPTINIRPTGTDTTTPSDSFSCREYATKKGYKYSVWDMTMIGTRQCNDYVQANWCSLPKSINLVQYCCMANC